ncbi:MAG: GspH/FimT family pseudopilin [Phycisphaerae bacterium]|nr:GspH/FimT family pseudopilin [Phycisphaerae bacterium]
MERRKLKSRELRQSRRGGFSLIEVIVVVILIAILATLVIPMMGTDDSAARGAALMVSSNLEYARSEATRRQASITVTFNTGAGTFTLSDAAGVALTNPGTGQDYIVNLPDEMGKDSLQILSADFGGTTSNSITFTSIGEPVQTGSAIPVGTDGVVIKCGDSQYRVKVKPITGLVTTVSE